jgi:DNA-binding GntR family transcriptional regulator
MLPTVSAVEALATQLERRVLDGDLAAGERLREVETAAAYGVGRYTVRTAFDVLVRRGLLERTRNRGAAVRALDAVELRAVFAFRTALEVEAFRLLAAEQRVPADAREAVEQMRTLTDADPWRRLVRADLAFHTAIVAETGNRLLVGAHDDVRAEILLGLAQLGRGFTSASTLAADHQVLLDAIRSGEAAAADEAIREHLGRAGSWLQEPGTPPPRPPAAQ